jgi:sugar/nucleoside kinase (ribokinase family)
MPSKIVVAGVASLYMSLPVEEFPIRYQACRSAAWLRVGAGGAGMHIARILRALGNEVSLCTIVGRDRPGDLIRAELLAGGLLGPSTIDAPASSLGVVLVAPDGRRMGRPCVAMVNAVDYPAEIFRQSARSADLAVLTNAQFTRPLLKHARYLGIPIAVDVHLIADVNDTYNRPWLEVADIVFCSHERLPCPPAEWVGQIFARFPGCSVAGIGCGGDGCVLGLSDGRLVRVAAQAPRGVVSTAGAGDTLFASFLHTWLATGNAVRAVERGVLYAGWKVGDSFPTGVTMTGAQLDTLEALCPVQATISRWDTGQSWETTQAG